MNIKYITYALTAVIGLSSMVCFPTETVIQADQIQQATQSEAAPAATTVTAVVAPPDTAPAKKLSAPILVPFNQALYQLCCERRQSHHWNAMSSMIFMLTLSSMAMIYYTLPTVLGYAGSAANFGIKAVTPSTWIGFKDVLTTGCSSGQGISQHIINTGIIAKNFLKGLVSWNTVSNAFNLLSSSFFGGLVIGQGYLSAKSMIGSVRSLISLNDYKNFLLWEDRELVPLEIKQQVWRQIIYTCLGNPIVEGTVPTTGRYHFIGDKKYGAGKVIFDPFDEEQIKILLGIHPHIAENLQCTKLTVVTLEQ